MFNGSFETSTYENIMKKKLGNLESHKLKKQKGHNFETYTRYSRIDFV